MKYELIFVMFFVLVASGYSLSSETAFNSYSDSIEYKFYEEYYKLDYNNTNVSIENDLNVKFPKIRNSLNSTILDKSTFDYVNAEVKNITADLVYINCAEPYYSYIESNLNYNTTNESSFADFVIDCNSSYTTNSFGYASRYLKFYNNRLTAEFDSVVASFEKDYVRHINFYQFGFWGLINNIKFLISNQEKFFKKNEIKRTSGLSAIDMACFDIVRLYEDEMSEEEMINYCLYGLFEETSFLAKTNDDVLLRLIERKSILSDKYKNYVVGDVLPTAFSGGLWADLYTWNELSTEMSDKGHDTYMIEITGGPYTECADCINYDFEDLTDSFWPTLIGSVTYLVNGSKINYVGHSNGGRTAISSLEKWNEVGITDVGYLNVSGEWVRVSMPIEPVDMLIGVGVPGAFEGKDLGPYTVEIFGDNILNKVNNFNLTHFTISDAILTGLFNKFQTQKDLNKSISVELFANYYKWIDLSNDPQPGENLNLQKLVIIQGSLFEESDGIVTTVDENKIYENINTNKSKYYFNTKMMHFYMSSHPNIKSIIERSIENKKYTIYQKTFNLEEKEIKYEN